MKLEFTFISKLLALLFLSMSLGFLSPQKSFAAFEDIDQVAEPPGSSKGKGDIRETPYTTYGEFNEEEDEAESALFFQFGRFFGVSLGVGVSGATGNRGLLWQGGFPMVAVRVHYWFDFNFALQLEFSTANHFFTFGSGSVTDVNLSHLGADIKYYFDTRDLASAITFANPYILLGGGVFTKAQSSLTEETVDTDSKFGFTLGAGLEFVLSHKKAYFVVEGKANIVSFEDRFTTQFQSSNIEDQTGVFWSVATHVLFTW